MSAYRSALSAMSAAMRYEAPYCPWCPTAIRAWLEGQPWGLGQGNVTDVRMPSPPRALAIPQQRPIAPTRSEHAESARIAEIVRFARRRGYRKIGIATCAGSEPAAEVLRATLADAGFEVFLPEVLEQAISEAEPWLPELAVLEPIWTGPRCDPAAQAKWLNAEGCDLNIAVGLCVGCDSVFFRHAEAPTTVLPVDGHAPDIPRAQVAQSQAEANVPHAEADVLQSEVGLSEAADCSS